ncbi:MULTISPECIES: bifunctional 2-polyprenyl-6-hydroxyphenol methylase/3-demethylubiquinol 3-O-methyltransferase UbiG [unclassified Synechocystis]|uniref:class I SAM-dependent methyltransferase n=1 Tax=unclassified Synechocystis TaxID=2640012 RepID=UPI0004257327|nr:MULTISPECIES: class I SAM-dependent methyltransferase [unclassified Synechocystis]AIE73334.1 hypothetical protein D082_08050 [Synechocystis sp. PCC 6714]MCT0253153.1 class I SAM-dependent methyltransferase [Synechocystis sp. CS-94]
MGYVNYFAKDCLQQLPWQKISQRGVLIVGCGKGLDCAEFTDFGWVHGVDVCRDLGRDFSHPKVTYFRESAEAMERQSDCYDLVFSVATLEHIHDLLSAFREIYRVTKSGGLIYTVAAPLWNSAEGHHLKYLGLFSEFPWIHLRLSPTEIKNYIYANKTAVDLQDWIDILQQEQLLSVPLVDGDLVSYAENLVNFLSSDYFNRLPASCYINGASQLPVNKLIRNELWQDGETLLTPDVLIELISKGFTKKELLAVSHNYVAVK